jgi:hypothetical protein
MNRFIRRGMPRLIALGLAAVVAWVTVLECREEPIDK